MAGICREIGLVEQIDRIVKQVVVALLTTYRSALPTWIQALDGNTNDSRAFPAIVAAYLTQMGEGEVVENAEAIVAAQRGLGKFILATNELDEGALPAEEMLWAYKGQWVGPERGFRFLKDPWFFADSLFLKKPERIMALVAVMGLALLVYALAEHKLRSALQERGESIPDQVGKPTQRPTMRRVFQMFEGIDVLLIPEADRVRQQVLNLRPVHRQILRLLGPHVEKCYQDTS